MLKSTKSCLVDVNVWLALVYGRHIFHEAGAAWFGKLGDRQASFCRFTQLSLLRLLTNPRVMEADVRSQQQAWRIYEQLRSDQRVSYMPEPAGVDPLFRSFTQSALPETRGWSDAYLAATAVAAGCSLATLDRDFIRYKGLTTVLLGL